MRPNHKEALLQPKTAPGRLKKSRGRKRVRVQAKASPGSTRFSRRYVTYTDWTTWEWIKYLTIKDAQNAVTSLSQGYYKDTLMFRVHPDDLKGLEDARA